MNKKSSTFIYEVQARANNTPPLTITQLFTIRSDVIWTIH